MLGSLDDERPARPPKEFRLALQVLSYLTSAGNKAAERHQADIMHLSAKVWPDRRDHSNGNADGGGAGGHRSDTAVAVLDRDGQTAPELHGHKSSHAQANATSARQLQSPQTSWSEQSQLGPMDDWFTLTQFDQQVNFDLAPDAVGIYSSFNDPNLPLTGVDHMDWLEMERVFAHRDSMPTG